MKILIKGKYYKANGHWVVELPALKVQVQGANPFITFQNLQDFITKELGSSVECSFKIHDDGQFDLDSMNSASFVNYITRKIQDLDPSTEDMERILAEVKFKGDLD